MINYLKENKFFILGIAAALLVAFFIIGTRMMIESDNKSYDIVLDYDELVKMAEQSEHPVSWWLEKFKTEVGVNKVGLSEENIMSLMENEKIPVSGDLMGLITREAGWEDNYPVAVVEAIYKRGFDQFDVLVEIDQEKAGDFVIDALNERIRNDRFIAINQDGRYFALIDGTADVTLYSEKYKEMNSKNVGFMEKIDLKGSKIMYISLGFLPEKVDIIKKAGMEIVPRTLSYNNWNDEKFAEAVVNEYNKYSIEPKYIIVGGEAIIGYDEGLSFSENYLKKNNIGIGLIENTTQLQNIMQFGVEEISKNNNYNTVRVFSVWNYIQNRYQYYGYPGAEEIENTLFRAVTERNIRVIYFKPIMEFKDLHTYVTDPDVYTGMFSNLKERLEDHNLIMDDGSIMPDYNISSAFKIAIGIGVVLGAILLLNAFVGINRRVNMVLTLISVLAVFPMFFVLGGWYELFISLFAAIIFGCLSITLYTRMCISLADKYGHLNNTFRIIQIATGVLICSVLVALVGGIITAAPISSVNYMLEINIFRGVKVAQLLPIAYFPIAYLAYFGFGANKEQAGRLELLDIREMLNTSIKLWMIIIALFFGAIGAYYIIRTGHDSSIQVSSFEMVFRNKLEDVLLARPRTKEFLFAFPAIMLMVYASIKGLRIWTILFGVSGVLGVTSVINTFMHIRTPLYLGFIRTGYSLLFGIIIGAIGILAFDILYKFYLSNIKNRLESKGDRLEQE